MKKNEASGERTLCFFFCVPRATGKQGTGKGQGRRGKGGQEGGQGQPRRLGWFRWVTPLQGK